jgi:UDP-glucose 4-epimerase
VKILVTGAAGYIGSHTCVELVRAGFEVVAFDNLSNSSADALNRAGRLAHQPISLVVGDIRDTSLLGSTLIDNGCDAVIHFAGLKAVGESVSQPVRYYDNNVGGTLSLLKAMERAGLRRLVFSSSATVYGNPQRLPLDEDHPRSATNPYGQSKLMIEHILEDLSRGDSEWRITILRYFNPVGAHSSGAIGEDPCGVPNNLMPYVAQVAIGRLKALRIWGNDYPTPDGTGVRDYIHVIDLAQGHVSALQKLEGPGCVAINLGTGRGYSVLEVVRAFEQASGRPVPYTFAPRRAGDVASCYAAPQRASKLLGWSARHTIEQMCADHWRWQSQNPQGYA